MAKNRNKQGLVALGANLSFRQLAPQDTISAALAVFPNAGLCVQSTSRFFATPCFPKGAGPDYVNAAAVVTVGHDIGPEALLQRLHNVEAEFGRERVQRWGMRTLDLDLLALDDLVLPDPATQTRWRALPLGAQIGLAPDQLILPHPRLQDRAFVLVPLADVAPGWRHPVLGQSVAEMLAALPAADRAAVTPI